MPKKTSVNSESLKNGITGKNQPLVNDWMRSLLNKRLCDIQAEIAFLEKDAVRIKKLIETIPN